MPVIPAVLLGAREAVQWGLIWCRLSCRFHSAEESIPSHKFWNPIQYLSPTRSPQTYITTLHLTPETRIHPAESAHAMTSSTFWAVVCHHESLPTHHRTGGPENRHTNSAARVQISNLQGSQSDQMIDVGFPDVAQFSAHFPGCSARPGGADARPTTLPHDAPGVATLHSTPGHGLRRTSSG